MNELIELVLKRGSKEVMDATLAEYIKHGKKQRYAQVGRRHIPGKTDRPPTEDERKEMVRLHVVDGVSYSDIARKTGFSSSAVRHAVLRYRNGKGFKAGRVD